MATGLYLSISVALLLVSLASFAHTPHPLGKTRLAWEASGISDVYAMNFDFHGGDNFVVWRPQGRIEEMAGRRCLRGPYFFFAVDDAFAFDIDETVYLEITVHTPSTDGLHVSYDHAIAPHAKTVTWSDDIVGVFHTVRVPLERARWANRKYEHTDFALGALGAKHPQDPSVKGEISVCDIRLERTGNTAVAASSGKLSLTIRDEHGQATSARVGLYTPEGKAPVVDETALALYPHELPVRQWPLLSVPANWTSPGRFIFYADGRYQATLPAGEYELRVYKGPEYGLFRQRITIEKDNLHSVEVALSRWRDLPSEGWFSGDDHVHVSRPDAGRNDEIVAFTSAEGVHVTNLLQMTNIGERDNFRQYAFGEEGHHGRQGHYLVSGQESPRTSHRGHSIGLNADRLVWTEEHYFLYDRIAAGIKEAGGLWGYAHVALDTFNVKYGLALDMPLGAVDFMEVLQMGHLSTDYLFDFLNLGFRVLPSAGSDFPYIHIAGAERIYVRIPSSAGKEAVSAMKPADWFDAWTHGRSFVSNGPIIDWLIDGQVPLQDHPMVAGERLYTDISVSANPDLGALQRVELIVDGEVIAITEAQELGATTLQLHHEWSVQKSGWMVVRAEGEQGIVALTAPVYITLGDDPRTWTPEKVPAIASRYSALLKSFAASTPDLNESWERFAVEEVLLDQWREDRPLLEQRVQQALGVYEQLIADAQAVLREAP
jgi:hypothetical protein